MAIILLMKLDIKAPPVPNRKRFPFVASLNYKGLVIDIENLDGSVREGISPDGKKWQTKFKGAHYGEIRNSSGTDGDPLDVYIKSNPVNSDTAYIIHQNHPGNHPTKAGTYDEDKVVLGVKNAKEAKELYLRHYNRKDFFRSITEMPLSKFKKYIFKENKGEKVAAPFIRARLRGDEKMTCETPGKKIRSKGKGRGLAIGKGKGPLGRMSTGNRLRSTNKRRNAIKEAYFSGARRAYEEFLKEAQNLFNPGGGVAPLTSRGTPVQLQSQPVAGPAATVGTPGLAPPTMPIQFGPQTREMATGQAQFPPLRSNLSANP